MTKLILTAIIVVGGGIFWVWKRYWSVSAEIRRKDERIGQILEEQQDALENNDTMLFDYLDRERLCLCQEIANLRR